MSFQEISSREPRAVPANLSIAEHPKAGRKTRAFELKVVIA
jgi:hypothetical protein